VLPRLFREFSSVRLLAGRRLEQRGVPAALEKELAMPEHSELDALLRFRPIPIPDPWVLLREVWEELDKSVRKQVLAMQLDIQLEMFTADGPAAEASA
jgi:hypothetical protein